MRIKSFAFVSFLLTPLLSNRLPAQPTFQKIDAWADSISLAYADPADLARQLAAPYHSDTAKARAIYAWIAQHIRYDVKKPKNSTPPLFIEGRTPDQIQQLILQREKDLAHQTLRKKRGGATEFSTLFKTMCDAVNLEAAVIDGYGRSFYKPFRKLPKKPNHSWNAVKVGGQWQLVDVTWGAGYLDEEETKFTPDYQPGYFCTPPQRFAQDHLPLDAKWQLLEHPVTAEAFPTQLYVNSAQVIYPIEDYSPKSGRIPAKDGQMEMRVKFAQTPPVLIVASRNTKALPFEQKSEEGYVVLTFKKPRRGEVGLYGGEQRGKKGWLLRYNN